MSKERRQQTELKDFSIIKKKIVKQIPQLGNAPITFDTRTEKHFFDNFMDIGFRLMFKNGYIARKSDMGYI